MKIGVINAGGDTQAINAAISAIVTYGISKNIDFLGFIKGFEGILNKDYIELDLNTVKGISKFGGTILHSVNKGRFAGKIGEKGEAGVISSEILDETKTILNNLGIEALIVIGGDGTLSVANQLHKIGVNIVGVPKTIDNDLESIDETFGFSSACEIVTEEIDRLQTTAESHDRVMFVETMGRNVGWIPLYSGIAGDVDAILIPEISFDFNKLINFLREEKKKDKNFSIVVVSEGATSLDGTLSTKENLDNKPEVLLGGITEKIISKIHDLAPNEFEMRNVVLGHIQRGGTPDSDDRVLAKIYGTAAIDAVIDKKFGTVVAIKNKQIENLPIDLVVSKLKKVSTNDLLFQTAKKLGIYLGE
jgi:6-phosphofructokinase